MRAQEACEAEWSLVCAAHNLLKLYRYGAAAREAKRRREAACGMDFLAAAA